MALSWAAKRKLSYLAGFLAVLAIIVGIPLFFILYQKPTCYDGIKNGNEDGIDCGGGCVQLCKPLELQPVVLWQQKFKVAPGFYSVAAYIQNPNLNAESKNFVYTFTLYDSDNQKIAERKGKTYIPAGKSFAVFESSIQTGERVPTRVTFDYSDDFKWQIVRQDIPKLLAHNPTLTNSTTSPSVDVDIENTSFTSLERVDVTALVYNLEGNAIAASRSFVSNLQKKSEQHVVFTWPYPFVEKDAVRIEIITDIPFR